MPSMHLWPYASSAPDSASTVAVVGSSSRPRPTRKRSYSQPQEYHPHPSASTASYYHYPSDHGSSSGRRDDREQERDRDRRHSSQAPPPRTSSSSGYYYVEKTPLRSSVESHESRGRERERRDSVPSQSSRHTRTSSSSHHHIEGNSSSSRHRAAEDERRALEERERQYAHQYSPSVSSSHKYRSRSRSGSQVRWATNNEVQTFHAEDHPSRTARSSRAGSRSPSPNGILRNSPSGSSSRAALPDYANEPWLTIPSREVSGRPRSSSGSRNSSPVALSAHASSDRSRRSSITHGRPVYPLAAPSSSSQSSSSSRVLRRSLSQDRLGYPQQSQAMQLQGGALPQGYYQVYHNGAWYQYR